MRKLVRLLRKYLKLQVGGQVFGKTLAFSWGNTTASRPIVEVSVAGLTIGLTAGLYF